MKYWSVGILDGDGPLSLVGVIEDMIDSTATTAELTTLSSLFNKENRDQTFNEEYIKVIHKIITTNQLHKSLYQSVGKIKKLVGDNQHYDEWVQVLGCYLMRFGVPLLPTLREELIAICKRDKWAKTNPERKAWMNYFVEQVETYHSTPVDIKTTSSVEQYLNHLSPMIH